MQCRLPPTCEPGNFFFFSYALTQKCIISDISNNRCETENLFGFAALNPPLCVTNVEVFRILRVEVGHNVHPSEKRGSMFNRSITAQEQIWQSLNRDGCLLFTVNSWVFPTGLTNKDPIFHFICGERAPLRKKQEQSPGYKLVRNETISQSTEE